MNQISPTDLQQRFNAVSTVYLLDVRERYEYEFVAFPDSYLIPLGELPLRYGEIKAWQNEEIIIYCHHGIRSQHAISFLASVGFDLLFNLQGGIDGWACLVDPTMPRY
ncbi:MAG: putative adenylyltransferase/sulfurtransferase MoeZ [Verrucomicrobia subdivision 3 bacterium]|nr:putative adenylyltransferase/sulfurtransferase MoeZ [Limisphaerales bacterium]MCS1412815.1 putative adenylyltransferase/sulfurtransferase MoeZ [Limisphaerales bacterium]